MPDFDLDYIEIEPSEFVDKCTSREKKELIEILVEDGWLPKSVLIGVTHSKSYSRLQEEFSKKLEGLLNKFHSISKEDEEILETLFKKYL